MPARRPSDAALARLAVAAVWIWHGLVPKLLARDAGEVRLMEAGGLAGEAAIRAVLAVGAAEVAFGALILLWWRARWPMLATVLVMPLATLGVAATAPAFLDDAFTPVTLNLATAVLAFIAWRGADVEGREG